jgi:hypothetical protein
MNPATSPHLRLPLLVAAASAVVLAAGGIARASLPEEMLQKAETACLEKATSEGWRADQSSVVSREAIDDEQVKIVLDLSKDGVNTARLTCPFSARTGVVGQMGALGEALNAGAERTDFGQDFVRSMATAADSAQAVNRSQAWWMLLPIGLAGISWAALRGRGDGDLSDGGSGLPVGGATLQPFTATASGKGGQLVIHEQPDEHSLVHRRVDNGQLIALTGRAAKGWLAVDGGGWARESDLHNRQGGPVGSALRR